MHKNGLSICHIQYLLDNIDTLKHCEIAQYIGCARGVVGSLCKEMGIYREPIRDPVVPRVREPGEIKRFTAQVRQMLCESFI
ncbi:MAG: hypothetical protein JL50_10990 [Peptococcaceae bacterium BICA1-7]|nr:MAG: hypothetical protein JL50_10990 [Peptococcaceae bacterium BICA1-7]HBV95812.1 hypothetical protein [Desulfotomaculum sp.]